MEPFVIIGIMLIIQIVLYVFLYRYNKKKWTYLVLLLYLVAYIFILPYYFIAEYSNDELRCGMPALGITLAFWVFGGGATLLTHITYLIIVNIIKRKRSV